MDLLHPLFEERNFGHRRDAGHRCHESRTGIENRAHKDLPPK